MEIPLVIRILRRQRALKVNVSDVLTADYVGALIASISFPIFLLPQLGLIRTALLFGELNLVVAGLTLYVYRAHLTGVVRLAATGGAVAALLAVGFIQAERAAAFFESRLYAGEIIFSQTTPYQRVVLTRDAGAVSLFINGSIQFNTLDEYRYHEPLVHPAMTIALRREEILILGGGDGLALREVLKYRDVRAVTVVDLDPVITRLFATNELLRGLNADAYADPRVDVVNMDAWKYLERSPRRFDVIIIDLPDPHDIGLSKLYTRSFYTLVAKHLPVHGIVVTQATSPLYAGDAFWCIERTMAAAPSPYERRAELHTSPYHNYVPSLGEWGFVMASPQAIQWPRAHVEVATRYLTSETLPAMRSFAPDMAARDVDINTLHTHALVAYYERGWSKWYQSQ